MPQINYYVCDGDCDSSGDTYENDSTCGGGCDAGCTCKPANQNIGYHPPGGGVAITRGVPSQGATTYGPRGGKQHFRPNSQEQNFYNNASGVRGMNYLCDIMGRCDGDQVAKRGEITNSSQGRFAVDPTTIRPSDYAGFDGSNGEFMLDNEGSPSDLWFNQSGDNVITVGGDKYSFQPVLSWNAGCDTMDDSGDGIFPDQNCASKPGVGGVPGLGVSALRWKNGVMY